MCMIDGADHASVSNHYEIKSARKEHQCSECRRTIAKGESYHRAEMVMEGRWYTFHVCRHCRVACQWLREQCGGWLYEGVLEDIQEHGPVYKIARLYRLEVGMKRKWKRFDGSGLMAIPPIPAIAIGDHRVH